MYEPEVLYQGTALAVPQKAHKILGFSPAEFLTMLR